MTEADKKEFETLMPILIAFVDLLEERQSLLRELEALKSNTLLKKAQSHRITQSSALAVRRQNLLDKFSSSLRESPVHQLS